MTRTLWVKLHRERYPIIIGVHVEKQLVAVLRREGKGRRIAVITDGLVARRWGPSLKALLKRSGISAEFFQFPHSEKHKNQGTVTKLQHSLLKKRFGRDTLVVAFGGGVVGDVAGFVAATYLRGIPYIQVPTTLLAIVDSSVGGKVGVDTAYGKNMIGAFYQPRAVVADLAFVSSLSREQVVNGLIEALKKFMTSEKHSLALVQKLDLAHPLRTPRILLEIVYRAVRAKVKVVMIDEEEKNERRILNFGHTVGHAIEFLSGYRMPHGFAVAYGILVETKISELLGILSPKERAAIAATLTRFRIYPSALRKYPPESVLRAIKGDKKARRGMPHYVLLRAVGSVYTKGGQWAHPVPERIVKKAFLSLVRA